MASARLVQIAFEAARRAVAPIVEKVAEFGPVPRSFWRDPYVLGYLAGMGGLAGQAACNSKLGHKDLTRAALRAIAAFAGAPPRELRDFVESGGELVHAEFEDGFLASAKVVASLGGVADEIMHDEDVREAAEYVDRNRAKFDELGIDEDLRVTKMLEVSLFFGYVAAEYFPHLGPKADSKPDDARATAAE